MKKLIFIAMLCASASVLAGPPPYHSEDPGTKNNFDDIYNKNNKHTHDGQGSSLIDAPSATITSLTATNLVNGSSLMFRNRIINGDMRVNQRVVTVSSQTYGQDRWLASQSGIISVSRASTTTAPTGFTHALLATVVSSDTSIAASDRYSLEQRIEGFNIGDFGFGSASAKSITISFWVRSTVAGAYSGAIRNSAGDRGYAFDFTIDAANTWEQKAVVIAGDTSGTWIMNTNGIGLALRITLMVGTDQQATANTWSAANVSGTASTTTSWAATINNRFFLTGVQLEEGTVVTPYEWRSYQAELNLCLRYYEKSYDISVATGTGTNEGGFIHRHYNTDSFRYSVRFRVEKRTTPTVVVYNATTGNTGQVRRGDGTNITVTNEAIGCNGFAVENTGSIGSGVLTGHYTADAEL